MEQLTEQTLLPDLLRAAPQARAVLDRYGLRGCGGPGGPVESIRFFARAHDVPLEQLLEEIRGAAAQPEPTGPAASGDYLADNIYRPFFKAGIAIVLTLGATWGAWLLWRIGLGGAFRGVGLHEVNAHGHAQIFGWVGLFVMGFAFQAFPRFKHTSLSYPRLAYASLWLMVAGLLQRSLLEPIAADSVWLTVAALSGSGLEILAIALFGWVIATTWRGSGKPLALYDYYISSAMVWFGLQALYDAAYFAATLTAGNRDELVGLVATWQGPLREMQIHGFALLMILGVSQRVFPHFYGLPAPGQRLSWIALFVLNAAVIGEVLGSLLMRLAGHAWAGLWYVSVIALTGTVIVLVRDWRIYSATEHGDRSLKFLRTAYGWLFVSLGMLLLLPVYQYVVLPGLAAQSDAARTGFSHAYYGAARHAITVGFVSMMIMGMAAKIVPTLNGVDLHALSRLWWPFALINTGCALRVTAQILTDFTDRSFSIIGFSGTLEVLALAWWGGHLWRVMSGRSLDRSNTHKIQGAHVQLSPGQQIESAHCVGEVLERYPKMLETFVAFGFTPLRNPLARRTLAHHVTIAGACRILDVDMKKLLDALNLQVAERPGVRVALPVLPSGSIRVGAGAAATPETVAPMQPASASRSAS